jgi:hypothetical protein
LRNHIRLGLAGIQILSLIHQMNRSSVAMDRALAPLPHRGTDAGVACEPEGELSGILHCGAQ